MQRIKYSLFEGNTFMVEIKNGEGVEIIAIRKTLIDRSIRKLGR